MFCFSACQEMGEGISPRYLTFPGFLFTILPVRKTSESGQLLKVEISPGKLLHSQRCANALNRNLIHTTSTISVSP